MTVDDVRAFHAACDPAGRRDAGGGRRLRSRRRSSGSPPSVRRLAAARRAAGDAGRDDPAAARRGSNIVPRPGAPQSELRIGHVAVARNTPDYHALVAANMVLGGQFVSRINLNLREDKGFTYGARTSFDFRRLPGSVRAAGQRADGRDRGGDPGVDVGDRRDPRIRGRSRPRSLRWASRR